jgi:hypothetical protein
MNLIVDGFAPLLEGNFLGSGVSGKSGKSRKSGKGHTIGIRGRRLQQAPVYCSGTGKGKEGKSNEGKSNEGKSNEGKSNEGKSTSNCMDRMDAIQSIQVSYILMCVCVCVCVCA